jgi:hypothetical protein
MDDFILRSWFEKTPETLPTAQKAFSVIAIDGNPKSAAVIEISNEIEL